MAINLQSLSLTSAFSSIVNFFKSQENNLKYKDLSNGSEGSFLIRLLANIFSTLSYRIVAQSRENYLSTAALPASNIGLSVNLGYSAFRGSNLKRLIRIIPNGNYTLPHLSQIGTYDGVYNIYVLRNEDGSDVELVEGVPTEVRTVVGNIKEETIVAGTSAIKVFSLFTTGISEDYSLFVDSREVPTTNVIKKMTEDKYLVRTNPYSSVDIMYLNTFSGSTHMENPKYTYGVDSQITIRYIELADVGTAPYTADMFETYGTLTGVANISTYLPFESVEQMKINAPLNHETQNLIRSKQDYANRLKQIVPANIGTNWKALTPTYTQITYLKNDFTMLTQEEESKVQALLADENFFGTPLPDITPPRREVAHLKVQAKLNTKYKNIADVNMDVENILESYYDAILGSTFNTFDLERKIESLSYVKYARVGHILDERKPNTLYQLGYMVTHDDTPYIASKILGNTGDEVPQWQIPPTPTSDIDTGLITKDGSLVWKTYKRILKEPYGSVSMWKVNAQFGLGDFVYDPTIPNYMFKCVGLIKSSGFEAPDLTFAEIGDFFVDGSVVWVAKEYSETYDSWEDTHNYQLGDSVNVPTSTNLSLECVSFTGSSGTKEKLDFSLREYPILSQGSNYFTVEGNKTFYFVEGDAISALYPEGATNYQVSNSVYNGENTVITIVGDVDSAIEYQSLIAPERGVQDGNILWTVIDDVSNITYPWNSYTTFDYTLEIIE